MSHWKTLLVLCVSSIGFSAAAAVTSTDAGDVGGRIASILAAGATMSGAPTGQTTTAGAASTQTEPLSCAIVQPDPNATPPVVAQCACMPGNGQCPQYSTPGMFHTNVCKSCETDFVELSTTSSDLPQETVLSQCIVQSQVGVNQNEAQSLASCGVPFTSTISGTIFEWPGQIVTQVTGFAGTVETTGETVTIPVGSSTPIATVAPTITAISATGSPNDATQGVWIGPMTGSDLWFNISSAVESACTGDVFPITKCNEPVITGVPYPSKPVESGYKPELAYGDLRINFVDPMSIRSAKERSLFAYYLGMNAAASVKRMGDDACKTLHTAQLRNGGKAGFQEGPSEDLMGCFMPVEFVLLQDNGEGEENSILWSQFYFTGEHGQSSELECQAVNAAVDGILAFVMVALSLIPGGGVAANGIRTGVRAGTREARGLGVRAVQAGEAIKFGCKSIEDAKHAADGESNLSSGGDTAEENTDGLLDSLLGDGSEENPWQQDLSKISDTWDKFQGILGV